MIGGGPEPSTRADALLFFLRRGYLTVAPSLPLEFHREMFGRISRALEGDAMTVLGNNLLPLIPQLGELLDDPAVAAATELVLGRYLLHPHRSVHQSAPGGLRDPWHKETYGGAGYKVRNHRPWWAALLYYPQETTEHMGPTAILPGSHVLEQFSGEIDPRVMTVPAGSCVLMHYDLWHRRTASSTGDMRLLVKFELGRLHPPSAAKGVDGASDPWSEPTSLRWQPGCVSPVITHAHARWFGLEPPQLAGDVVSPSGLEAENWRIRIAALSSFDPSDPNARPVDAVANAVQDEHEHTAVTAAYALSTMGAEGARAAGWLIEHPDVPSARRAAYALAEADEAAVPMLIRALGSDREHTRCFAAFAAGEQGSTSDDLLKALFDAVHDGSPRVRAAATEALGLKGVGGQSVASLLDATRDESVDVRQQATVALARLGPLAEGATEGLQRLLRDENRYVQGFAAQALAEVGTTDAYDVLVPFLLRARWCALTTKASPW